MITPDHIHTGYELGHDIKREERQVVITLKTKIKVKSRHLIGTIFLSTRSCRNQNTVHNLHWNYFTNYTQIVKTSHSYVICEKFALCNGSSSLQKAMVKDGVRG